MSIKLTPGLTKAAKAARKSSLPSFTYRGKWYAFRDCEGEAHSNAHIDNCGVCAPFWGYLVVESTLGEEVDGHVHYLTHTLIPDLRESGSDATADDFERCVELLRQLTGK